MTESSSVARGFSGIVTKRSLDNERVGGVHVVVESALGRSPVCDWLYSLISSFRTMDIGVVLVVSLGCKES